MTESAECNAECYGAIYLPKVPGITVTTEPRSITYLIENTVLILLAIFWAAEKNYERKTPAPGEETHS
jgi:hypothetical protein